MPLIIPDIGATVFLDRDLAPNDYTYCLYKNNYIPVHGSTYLDFDEADFGGYVRELAAHWTPAVMDLTGRAISTADDVTFTRTAGPTNTIYGYFVLNGLLGLMYAEAFAAPVVLNANGQFITITPTLTLRSEF